MFFILLVILIIWGEWRLKSYFESVYDFKKQKLICKDLVRLRKYHNFGAFLNIMEKKKKLLHAISIIFTAAILVGYLFGIMGKILNNNINYVLVLYLINVIFVTIDFCLYFVNRRHEQPLACH